ncbi:hypothetical protein [Psychrobacter pygoscelis]|uniref:hypothetical protein n=1 Tax=Psychrobacter pygoscelis TaxID=2488563 RepID=UPI00103A2F13|nr:hypothetical protein [Psychrobacter pygoscelis]
MSAIEDYKNARRLLRAKKMTVSAVALDTYSEGVQNAANSLHIRDLVDPLSVSASERLADFRSSGITKFIKGKCQPRSCNYHHRKNFLPR